MAQTEHAAGASPSKKKVRQGVHDGHPDKRMLERSCSASAAALGHGQTSYGTRCHLQGGAKNTKLQPTLAAAADSLAWRQALSPKLGRHAVAEKDLPAGTLILVEKPVVAIPRSKLVEG